MSIKSGSSTGEASNSKTSTPNHATPIRGSADEKQQDPEANGEPQWDPAFEVSFSGDTDPRNPKSMSELRKWFIVIIVATTSLCVACTSSLYTGTYAQVEAEFGSRRVITTLGLSMFVVGLGLSPMVLAPLCEFYGRKPVYIASTFFFVVWIIPCAVAKNITTLVIARFLDGFAGAAFLSVAGGTVGDLFTKSTLQAPMMVYTASPFLGPELGPVIGNFINYYVNWRWTFWVLLIWAGVQFLLVLFCVPETYSPVLLRKEAQKMRKETGDDRWHAPIEKMKRSVGGTILRSCYRPFMLLLLEPMVLLLCTFCAVVLGVLYLFFGAFNLVFTNNHNFNHWQVGLSFLGIMVGMVIGILSDPLWKKNYLRLLENHKKRTGEAGSEPEYRLAPSIVGAPLVVIGLFWFGWTQYSFIHWMVPIVGSAFFGCGIILVFSGIFTFLVESYPLYAASALAANSFARSMFAAMFPLFGPAMYNNLGYQWATFLLTMICCVLAPFPYIFYKYGKRIRKRSRYVGAR
nr:putative mfs multidrug protein [Neofusicoccum parvum]